MTNGRWTTTQRWAAVMLVASLAGSGGRTLAQADPERVREGNALLDDGKADQAVNLFGGELEAARRRGDRKAEAELAFYHGLALQEVVRTRRLSDQGKLKALRDAVQAYEVALKLRREANAPLGSTLNNLAMTLLQLGVRQRAAALLTLAINLADSHQALYVTNYAELLVGDGDWRGAVRCYGTVAIQPGGGDAQRAIAALYARNAPAELPEYLRRLIAAGDVLGAQEIALDALQREASDARTSWELVATVAASLAGQRYDPAKFSDSATAKRLAAVADRRGATQMASELLMLHNTPPSKLKRESFKAWVDVSSTPQAGRYLDDLRSLMRSLGNWYRVVGDRAADARVKPPAEDARPAHAGPLYDQAEGYYRLAIGMIEREPDLDAVQACADLYLRARSPDQLAGLMAEYRERIFEAKGVAYRDQDWKKLYKFHRTLGGIYAQLGPMDGGVASARFQLERAIWVAEQWNARKPAAAILIEPQVVDQLEAVYTKLPTPDLAGAAALSVRMGEHYNALKLPSMAEKAIGRVNTAALGPEYRVRFDKLKTELAQSPRSEAPVMREENVSMVAVRAGKSIGVGEKSTVQLTPAIGGGSGASPLSEDELGSIGASLSKVLADPVAQERAAGAVRVVSVEQLAPDAKQALKISELKLDGEKGSVVIEREAGRVEVPFVVGGEKLKGVHIVREGTVNADR